MKIIKNSIKIAKENKKAAKSKTKKSLTFSTSNGLTRVMSEEDQQAAKPASERIKDSPSKQSQNE